MLKSTTNSKIKSAEINSIKKNNDREMASNYSANDASYYLTMDKMKIDERKKDAYNSDILSNSVKNQETKNDNPLAAINPNFNN